jgi:DeoR/GlpR family transcriptional regulator of sugar metabolism
MLPEERHNVILEHLEQHNKVLTAELCILLEVSIDTVRRDLTELERNGRLVKVHGGAISNNFHYPFQPQEVYAKGEKKEIARKALSLIQDGMVILSAGGTVMLELARIIPENLKGTFFTVSPLVALEVAQRSSVEVILLAGRLSRNAYICTGSSVVSQLSELNVDLCFMGTNGLSRGAGVTERDWEIAQVKKAMIKSAKKTAILCIGEKIGVEQKIQVCPLTSIEYLCTDLEPSDFKLEAFGSQFKIL